MRKITGLLLVLTLVCGCPWLGKSIQVGMVVSLPVEDSVFTATAWKGLERAQDRLGAKIERYENTQFEDFSPGINHFINNNFDMIISLGYYGADATRIAAEHYAEKTFVCVDHAYGGGTPNLAGASFDVAQAAYLAGYLAAGMTKTGVVAVMGGMNIPPVVAFMDGFANGVSHYNEVKDANVIVLGKKTFLDSFENQALAQTVAGIQLAAGADILMPVAGDAALGAAAAVLARGHAMIIGVDADMYLSAPEYKSIVLTSVVKNLDTAVFELVRSVKYGTFDGTDYVGTLANGGVSLAPFHDFDDDIPESLKKDLEALAEAL